MNQKKKIIFFMFLFFVSLLIVFFLKKDYYKVIKTYDGKIVKVLPSNVNIKLEDKWIEILYKTGKQFLTGVYNIEIKSSWWFTLEWWKYFRKWLDVAGWVRLTYKIDLSKYKQAYKDSPLEFLRVKKEVLNIIKRNIDNRISKLWVSDYSLRIINNNWEYYLQVEIWGVSDLDYAKSIIWKTVELEFMLPFEGKPNADMVDQRFKLASQILKEAVNSWKDLIEFVDPRFIWANIETQKRYNNWKVLLFIFEPKDKLPSFIKNNLSEIEKIWTWKVIPKLFTGALSSWDVWWFIVRYLWKTIEKQNKNLFNSGTILSWTVLSGKNNTWTLLKTENIKYNFELLFVDSKPYRILAKDPETWEILNGAYFKYATAQRGQNGEWVVVINFDDKWKKIFWHITEKYVWKRNAIFIWWKLITEPVIREPIRWGVAQISGNFKPEDAQRLAKELNEWALPAKLILIQEQKIAPMLGENALKGGVIAGIIGFVLIMLLLFLMYNWRWALIAGFSLLEFIVITLAIVKLIDYALSLAWLSALVLSIGMAVDANILMYERIREELKWGKSYWLAVIDWVKRSWNAIRDGNLTTFMIAFLLFMLGMNVFKGFGFMMMLSIIIVLSVIVPLTKALMLVWWEKNKN